MYGELGKFYVWSQESDTTNDPVTTDELVLSHP